MEKTIIDAPVIITAALINIMECMQTINQANMMQGAKIWMIVVQLVILATNLQTKHQLPLQQHLLKNKTPPQ
jgi:hypothetical protein